MEIQLKINEARKMNNKAVIQEENNAHDQNYDKNLKRNKWLEKQKILKEVN